MADAKISALPTADALTGAELILLSQDGADAQTDLDTLRDELAQITNAYSGFVYPNWPGSFTHQNAATLNAANLRVAFMGRIWIEGEATGKVLSAAGGGSIHWRPGSVTWADGSTNLRVGLQDLDITTGNPLRPDGTFDVYRDLVPGAYTLASSTVQTTAMTGGTGSKTLNHGDMVGIVFDMTARGGSDSVQVWSSLGGVGLMPTVVSYNGSAWSNVSAGVMIGIIFDDGTKAIIDGGLPVVNTAGAGIAFNDSSNPDERGITLEFPWDVEIDAVSGIFGPGAANGDFEIQVYADPLGTPASILPGGTAVSITAESLRSYNTNVQNLLSLGAKVRLNRNTKYAVALKAVGAGNVGFSQGVVLADAAWRAFLSGGTTACLATRNNGSGAFSETTTTLIPFGVRICGF